MPLRRETVAPRDPMAELRHRIAVIERKLNLLLGAGPTTIQRVDTSLYADPVQGEAVLHSRELTDQERADEADGIQRRTQQIRYHHNERWHSFGDFVILLGDPIEPVIVNDEALFWAISEDLDQTRLQRAEAFVRTAGSTPTVVDIYNDMTSDSLLINPLTIDAGDKHSTVATVAVGIDISTNLVSWRDDIVITIEDAGTGAKGLGLALGFS